MNEGELTIGGDDYLYFGYTSGGTNTLTNAAGGTLNLSSTNATPLNRYTGTAVLNNEGTLNLTVSGSHATSTAVSPSTTAVRARSSTQGYVDLWDEFHK